VYFEGSILSIGLFLLMSICTLNFVDFRQRLVISAIFGFWLGYRLNDGL